MKLDGICDDLLAERADLLVVLRTLDDAGWQTPTPAPGWSVLDQITHLAHFDDASRVAITDPDTFLLDRERAIADVDGFVDEVTRSHRHRSGPEVVAWLARAGEELTATARPLESSLRVPW